MSLIVSLSNLSNRRLPRPRPEFVLADERQKHWVEIFKDRVTEPLKEVLQEDMDWMTSRPILERLNRLHDVEQAHRDDIRPDIIRPSTRRPISNK